MGVAANVTRVKEIISETCKACGRDPSTLQVVAVTKGIGETSMRLAIDAGCRKLGENRVQEWLIKKDKMVQDVSWHFIGHLQTNKVREVIGKVALIHSLDRERLAVALDKTASLLGIKVPVLVQVNISGESSKHGFKPEEIEGFLSKGWEHLEIKGLMTMAPAAKVSEEARPVFRGLRNLAQKIAELSLPGVDMELLSMGMSDDFQVAIEEGANVLRLGRIIFGPYQEQGVKG